MEPRRRRVWLIVVAVIVVIAAAGAGPFLREIQTRGRLAETRAASDVETRRRAYSWLLESAPDRLLDDLVSDPAGRVTLVTGDYIRVGQRETSLAPMVKDLMDHVGQAKRVETLWSLECIRDESFARRTGEMLTMLMSDRGLDPALCHALNLLLVSEPGIRRASHLWLVAHSGFPPDFDWASPNGVQEAAVTGPRISEAARSRDTQVEAWIRQRRENRDR